MTRNTIVDEVDKTSNRRMTPYDKRVKGTFAEMPPKERGPPRPNTAAEAHANNYATVELGQRYSDLSRWIPLFKADLEEMNRNKVGRPFLYSDMMIWCILCLMTNLGTDLRTAAGDAAGRLAAFGMSTPSYTRLVERIQMLMAKIIEDPCQELLERYGSSIRFVYASKCVSDRVRRVGIDSSGLNCSCANAWRMRKWKTGVKDRGWLVIHALSDIDSGEILAYAITDDSVGDSPMLKPLVQAALDAGHRFDTVYADGAYSGRENWSYLCREHHMRFITSFKSNSNAKSLGCIDRAKAADLWCSMPYDEWAEVTGYGRRWKCECVFSDFKQLFGETVTSRTELGICAELFAKVFMFNEYKRIRARMIGVTGNGVAIA